MEFSVLILGLGQVKFRSNPHVIIVEFALTILVLGDKGLGWDLDVDLLTTLVVNRNHFFDHEILLLLRICLTLIVIFARSQLLSELVGT